MSTLAAYHAFLAAKVVTAPMRGFEISEAEVNPACKPHVRAIVPWMVRLGCAACFSRFGLQKTVTQLEVVRITREIAGGRGLIVCPLGARQEFKRDAIERLGWNEPPRFIRSTAEASDPEGLYITNYETVREGKIDPLAFTVASLDEAAVLRGFGGTKTFRQFMALFAGDDRSGVRTRGVPYRFVATATPSPNDFIELLAYAAYLDVMDVSAAKAQPLDAKILTPDGWARMGDLRVGDRVIAADGSATEVLGVYPQGERPIHRVTFSDGGSTECDAEHLWLTFTKGERERRTRACPRSKAKAGRVRTTAEIAGTLTDTSGARHSIPLVGAVQFRERSVLIDPWLLGILIGDGSLQEGSVGLASGDAPILERVRGLLPPGLGLKHQGRYNYRICGESRRLTGRGKHPNALLNHLRRYLLIGKRAWEKRVPTDYLLNSPSVRLEILRGLMDSDGHAPRVKRDSPRFVTTSAGLAEDVQWLARSLGGEARIRSRSTPRRPAYAVTVRMPAGTNPFWLQRKAEVWRSSDRLARFIVGVEPVGTKPAQCIAIAHPGRLYVTDDFVITHNTRFFKRDSQHADRLTLHGHKAKEFWMWVASWAIFLQRPSDLGPEYSDEGYDLPTLDVRWHEVPTDHDGAGQERDGQARLYKNAALGVQEASREKRESLVPRLAKLMEIRAEDPAAHRILWHDLEAERAALEASVPGVVSVYGSQDLDERERAVMAFADGTIQELAAKPVMLGAGTNLQRHCAWAVFLGIGFKFADFIQAIHRVQRYGQERPVRLDLIYTEAEREVRHTLEMKWRQHEQLVENMSRIIREYGLAHAAITGALSRSMGCERVEASGPGYRLVNNDAVLEMPSIESNSVGLVVTSVPFAHQYEYSPSYHDFGHTDDFGHFWRQMDFLTPELLRVLQPGRVAAIHVKDRITPGGINGYGFQTVHPLSDECVAHFVKHGFAFLGRKTVVTDVVRENAQTYRLGWTEQCKDGSRMGAGLPEYVLLFRKPQTDRSRGFADNPVVKSKTEYSRGRWQFDAHGFTRSNGDRPLAIAHLKGLPHAAIFKLFRKPSLTHVYDFERDVKIAEYLDAKGMLPPSFMLLQPQSWHPDVWTDVARMRTLNMLQERKGQEQHLCPIAFDIVDRLIAQFSQPGELVADPFCGLGTVPYCAIKAGRRGLGIELNPRYFADGAAYCAAAAHDASMPTMFDLPELEPAGKVPACAEAER